MKDQGLNPRVEIRRKSEIRTGENGPGAGRSADFQSAVSPISNRQNVCGFQARLNTPERLRVGNPRYSRLETCATAARTRVRTSAFGFLSDFGFRFSGFSFTVALALAFLITGCSEKEPGAASLPALPPAAVQITTVEPQRHVATEDLVGTVRAKTRAIIEARLSGRIEEMRVAAGQTVQRGDLLARLDARESQARLDRALAERDQAESDSKRFTSLLAQQAVTRQEFDSVAARRRVANAAVAEAETMLGYADLTAPFDGMVTRKLADVGDLASPGKPLIEIENPAALRLEAAVPEALMSRLSLGAKVAVSIPALDRQFEAQVSEIEPAADPHSRTFLVKIDLPPVAGLRSGQFGRVAVPIAETSILRVPASAVIQRGQLEMVFVAANQKAQMRLVRTGKRIGSDVELISGVSAGEQIVTDGAATLVDGQELR
jgi:RND family efflux transporter MFP subunit